MSHHPPFQAWTDQDVNKWKTEQKIQRSYQDELVTQIDKLKEQFNVKEYGQLDYDNAYPLYLVHSRELSPQKPTVLITGGVHGYETSGAKGAISFMATRASEYEKHFNFVCAPCVSPWGYETINRWNPDAIDPNRNFFQDSAAQECALLYQAVHNLGVKYIAHFDLHETTDTDNTVFRPALAQRDGIAQDKWDIPDGFYLVADSARVEKEFQEAIIQNVKKVTHIAPADSEGKIIGKEVLSQGVMAYDVQKLHLSTSLTRAKYVTTTEVYPDSPHATPEQCIQAQVAAIVGGLDYIQAQR
jgi:hypothetical protein